MATLRGHLLFILGSLALGVLPLFQQIQEEWHFRIWQREVWAQLVAP